MKNYVEICDHNSWLGETGDMIKALDQSRVLMPSHRNYAQWFYIVAVKIDKTPFLFTENKFSAKTAL